MSYAGSLAERGPRSKGPMQCRRVHRTISGLRAARALAEGAMIGGAFLAQVTTAITSVAHDVGWLSLAKQSFAAPLPAGKPTEPWIVSMPPIPSDRVKRRV